jgi:hypothetical protein
MKAESTIKPPVTSKFLIEQTGNGKCNVHFYENIEQRTTEDGDTLYSFDWYALEDVNYHDNLKKNIEANKGVWLKAAKDKENAEPEYTEAQRLQQDITDLMLESIEQGQQITDLELLMIGGNE